jgi:hypothetical protein
MQCSAHRIENQPAITTTREMALDELCFLAGKLVCAKIRQTPQGLQALIHFVPWGT